MRKLQFQVPPDFEGKPLKTFLRGPCRLSNKIMIRQKQLEDGILRNGVRVHVTEILSAGDLICLHLPDGDSSVEAVSIPLDIVWEDDDLLILHKPSNMPVYPTPGHGKDSLANAVAAYYQAQGCRSSFHPLYRLDKNTSGLLVLAKHPYAASVLASALEKEYTAICEGQLEGSGTIREPICHKPGHRIQREVGNGDGSQSAITHWRAQPGAREGYTLLNVRLETGRTHQIRVHFSHLGHPLAGDDMYGGSRELIGRQALHCSSIRLLHPVTQKTLVFDCPLPEDMCILLRK